MAEKRLAVTWGAEAEAVGTLVFESARPNSSQFVYGDAWLLEGRPTVSPDLLSMSGWQAVRRNGRRSPFPMAFADTEPDSWGRRVIDRAYRKSGAKQGRLMTWITSSLSMISVGWGLCGSVVRVKVPKHRKRGGVGRRR